MRGFAKEVLIIAVGILVAQGVLTGADWAIRLLGNGGS